jgi:hypothetical protein
MGSDMAAKKKIRTVSLEKMINKHVSKIGSAKRDAFENKLRLQTPKTPGGVCGGDGFKLHVALYEA